MSLFKRKLTDNASRPPFDEVLAHKLIDKRVIIGLTYLTKVGKLKKQEQLHGVVIKANDYEGVAIQLDNSKEIYWLPPDLRSFKEAPRGLYKLRSTGEIIEDPDYTSDWIIQKGNPTHAAWLQP